MEFHFPLSLRVFGAAGATNVPPVWAPSAILYPLWIRIKPVRVYLLFPTDFWLKVHNVDAEGEAGRVRACSLPGTRRGSGGEPSADPCTRLHRIRAAEVPKLPVCEGRGSRGRRGAFG